MGDDAGPNSVQFPNMFPGSHELNIICTLENGRKGSANDTYVVLQSADAPIVTIFQPINPPSGQQLQNGNTTIPVIVSYTISKDCTLDARLNSSPAGSGRRFASNNPNSQMFSVPKGENNFFEIICEEDGLPGSASFSNYVVLGQPNLPDPPTINIEDFSVTPATPPTATIKYTVSEPCDAEFFDFTTSKGKDPNRVINTEYPAVFKDLSEGAHGFRIDCKSQATNLTGSSVVFPYRVIAPPQAPTIKIDQITPNVASVKGTSEELFVDYTIDQFCDELGVGIEDDDPVVQKTNQAAGSYKNVSMGKFAPGTYTFIAECAVDGNPFRGSNLMPHTLFDAAPVITKIDVLPPSETATAPADVSIEFAVSSACDAEYFVNQNTIPEETSEKGLTPGGGPYFAIFEDLPADPQTSLRIECTDANGLVGYYTESYEVLRPKPAFSVDITNVSGPLTNTIVTFTANMSATCGDFIGPQGGQLQGPISGSYSVTGGSEVNRPFPNLTSGITYVLDVRCTSFTGEMDSDPTTYTAP